MSANLRLERDGDVAVIVIDNPPINAGSAEVRRGLLAAIREVDQDPTLRAAVLIGANDTFIAGSDLRELGFPLAEPQLPSVIAAIEACNKPFVAALHGAALGGGFELALGCDARVAAPNTVVGLPEVTLGIVPGAGGTQRLPRIVGTARAIAMICSGERVSTVLAAEQGLIDAVTNDDLRTFAVTHAQGLYGRKQRLRDRALPDDTETAIAAASKEALKAGKNRPAIGAAIALVAMASRVEFDQGLADERAVFQRLRVSREACALRHQFFAERDSAKHPRLQGVSPRPVRQIAVIGAGTMGTGIAIVALDAGFDVTLLEQDVAALERGHQRVRTHYGERVSAGKMNAGDAAGREARLCASIVWELVAHADLVIEAVFEDLSVKQQVFQRLDALARPGAVLATNTSYLDLDAIASATARPQDVVGLHFFSPANVMRLLEVVQGQHTAPDTLATALAVGKRMKKLPVRTGNAFGFIGNRIYAAYRRQCEFMLEDGALPEDVDTALEAWGFAMGPFAVADMSGLDIAWRMRQAQAATRDRAARYVQIPDRLCEAGRLGRKTGAGYYRYDPPVKGRQVDPTVATLIAQARADKGLIPRSLDASEIQRRALLTIANEAALLLGEGVAERASDVDVVLVNGYGFPRWEGGPVFWARERGVERLSLDMAWLAEVSGPGFVHGDTRHLFES